MKALPRDVQEKLQELREKFDQVPVPIVAIAKDLGIKIYETVDFGRTESGSIKKEDGNYIIYINKIDHPTRKRFTIAHEIAHFLLHKDYLNRVNESITNIKQPLELHRPINSASLGEKEKTLEIEANRLAADILMPQEEFKKVFNQANTIEEVAETFNVSPSAVTIRAKELLGLFMI